MDTQQGSDHSPTPAPGRIRTVHVQPQPCATPGIVVTRLARSPGRTRKSVRVHAGEGVQIGDAWVVIRGFIDRSRAIQVVVEAPREIVVGDAVPVVMEG